MLPLRSAKTAVPFVVTLLALPALAPSTAGAEEETAISRSLERIAAALERIERAQGFQVWLQRTEVAAVGLRELERQLDAARARVASIEEEIRDLEAMRERIELLARDPSYSADQAEMERRTVQSRVEALQSRRREAEARRDELETRFVVAQRDLEDRLADLDRQLRAP
jgi:chromosome segregation ATPase